VAETAQPGESVSQVARRHDMNANMLFTWRRQSERGEFGAGLPAAAQSQEILSLGVLGQDVAGKTTIIPAIPAVTPKAPISTGSSDRTGVIEIELPTGAVVRVDGSVDELALRRVLLAMKSAR